MTITIEGKTKENQNVGIILNAQNLLTSNAQEAINSLAVYEKLRFEKHSPSYKPKKEVYLTTK